MEGTPSEGSSLKQRAIRRMKLSVEAKVAAAVAMAFAVLTVGGIAQERSPREIGGSNGYGPTNGPALSQVILQGSESSLSGLHGGRDENQVFGPY
jgi:hypothetical protein